MSATELQKVTPASFLGCTEMLLVALIVDPTARSIHSKRLPTARRLLALPLQQQIQCRASGFVQSLDSTSGQGTLPRSRKQPSHTARASRPPSNEALDKRLRTLQARVDPQYLRVVRGNNSVVGG